MKNKQAEIPSTNVPSKVLINLAKSIQNVSLR